MAVFVAGSGSARNKKNKRAGATGAAMTIAVASHFSPLESLSFNVLLRAQAPGGLACVRRRRSGPEKCRGVGRMKNAHQRKRAGKFTINRGDAGLQSAGRRGPEPSIKK